MLQRKFEEDKKRMQQLRAARKFRPYWVLQAFHKENPASRFSYLCNVKKLLSWDVEPSIYDSRIYKYPIEAVSLFKLANWHTVILPLSIYKQIFFSYMVSVHSWCVIFIFYNWARICLNPLRKEADASEMYLTCWLMGTLQWLYLWSSKYPQVPQFNRFPCFCYIYHHTHLFFCQSI